MNMKVDVAVLGAGIVGVCAALHLQARGRSVALIDRNASAGAETSYGNAGLIERSSIVPYMFPRDLPTLVRYALNGSTDARYHLAALPRLAPFLLRYMLASSPAGIARSTAGARPLIERCLAEHEVLMEAAEATHLMRRIGWIKAFRRTGSRDEAFAEAERLGRMGLSIDTLDPGALAEREPHLGPGPIGALHFRDPAAVSDPGALVRAYKALFVERGGRFLQGDGRSLQESGGGWQGAGTNGTIGAREVVVALGPWSDLVFRTLGYRLPFAVKRGYHRHFRPRGNAVLTRPVLDFDGGYLLAPMAQGIRLTTGAEFALRDARPTPVQMARAEPVARALFPLGEAVEPEPWMGARPCLPDMLPILGPAPRHRGLWFDFGHQHHGLTLGPVSGRLLAEMMTGDAPFTDPAPYSMERFG